MTTELNIQGMTCNNCARHVTEALRETPGVARASVSLEENRATVTWREDAEAAPDKLISALREAGYEGAPIAAEEQPASKWSPLQGWRFNVFLGLLATVPMLIAEWGFGLGMRPWYHWVAFALATPVQIFCGWRFYRGAWLQAKSGGSNMDTLVALGSTTAYAFSLYQVLRGAPGHLYFMDAAAIITLISVGHWMEAKVSVHAEQTLKALLRLAPDTARQIIDGAEREVAVSALHPDDLVALRPGDHIPTDGEVVEGESAVDESMLTGESAPIEKRKDAKLYAGSVNSDGRIVMRVTALGEQTALAKIIEVVQRAQNSRAKIQKLGDRVSAIFVPIVVLIAIATAIGWFVTSPDARAEAVLIHAAAVLIIACPCAMGLATPIAIMAGANAAAKHGILIRDGEALEKSGAIDTILFDKTGTLTEGRMTLAAFEARADNAKTLTASVASASRHPLSLALAELSSERLRLELWQEHRGRGVSAKWKGQAVCLGSLNWFKELKIPTASADNFIAAWTQRGASVLLLALDSQVIGMFALADQLKSNALEVIEQLKRAGKSVAMVTGDNTATAHAIAAKAGVSEIFAEVRPEQKAEIIQRLQREGRRVAFVGDGINDAPALAAGDLGIALGSGADAARQAADIILLRAGLEGVPRALDLAQATLRTIKQNLFWAFFYNAVGIPLAAFGFFSPILSAAAMGLSDLFVIGNALRLRNRRDR
jgi:Cu+-exporting ATPase